MEGSILRGRYRIDDRIGQGGFARVYRGFDMQLKRVVAVKVLISAGDGDRFKGRFVKESEAMARLRHVNIATVFDYGEDSGRPFLVMEYIDGPALSDVCDELRTDITRTVDIARAICDAMDYAHREGIIHRDLTLRNMMIDQNGHVRLLDFGLAKILHAEQQSSVGVVVGTPSFMAPEQAAGKSVDTRVDIFAFGVCIYRILAGHLPFEAEHPTAVLYMIGNENPDPLPPEVPADLQDVIFKCLEKKPEDRYQAFVEVKAALDSFRNGRSESSSPAAGFLVPGHRGSHNPYLNRVMIKNPDDFYGRQREIKRIYSRLDAPRPQSVSIVGDRRIGKSSLLNFIYNRRNRRLLMENHSASLFLYMDLQRTHDIDMERFIDMLFSMINLELTEEISATRKGRSLELLSAAIEKLDKEGMRIIVLMDEFDAVTNNAKFDMQFFSFLRFLANNYRVAYVTSSHSDLQQMCHDRDIADSPFFNIFSTLQLRPFSHDEAVALIVKPSGQEGIPLEPYVDRILSLSGYFPLFIQIACASVYEELADRSGAEPDWDGITRVFTEEALPHYAFAWERMDEVSRGNLRRIAAGDSVDRRFVHVNEDLVRRGYLFEANGSFEICSEPFRSFVESQDRHHAGRAGQGPAWRRLFGRK